LPITIEKTSIQLRTASHEDMKFIKEHIEKFRLDDEDLDYRQFVVAVDGKIILGFGRIRPHKEVYELGCVGVVEDRRNQGIGKVLVEHLINIFPSNEVYITTDIPAYFEKFGFNMLSPSLRDLVEKLKRVCASKRREGAVVMSLSKLSLTPVF